MIQRLRKGEPGAAPVDVSKAAASDMKVTENAHPKRGDGMEVPTAVRSAGQSYVVGPKEPVAIPHVAKTGTPTATGTLCYGR